MHAIQPIQQPAYIAGKNATDAALIIDAMDLLYSGNVDVFFLVSSDSDFTRLAMRLRESGRRVYGIGAQKTHISFQNACDRFTFTEVLTGQSADAAASSRPLAVAGGSRAAHGQRGCAGTRRTTRRVRGAQHPGGPRPGAGRHGAGRRMGAAVDGRHLHRQQPPVLRLPQLRVRPTGPAPMSSLDFVDVKGVAGPDGSSHPWVTLKPTAAGS